MPWGFLVCTGEQRRLLEKGSLALGLKDEWKSLDLKDNGSDILFIHICIDRFTPSMQNFLWIGRSQARRNEDCVGTPERSEYGLPTSICSLHLELLVACSTASLICLVALVGILNTFLSDGQADIMWPILCVARL